MLTRSWRGLFTGAAIIGLAACGGDAGEQADEPQAGPGAAAPAAQPAPQPAPGANVELPEGVTQDMVASGKTVFETTTCWTCHGMDGAGGPLAPSLIDDVWLNVDGSYDAIVQLVNTGVLEPKEHPGPMPPMGGAPLSEEQVRQVAAYVYALGHGG
ncbi:MAG: cytochrome c [Gemmatimonadota bacterium]